MNPADHDADPHDGQPPLSPEEEAAMKEEIDILFQQYQKITPPSLLPVLREQMEHALRTHPYPRRLLKAFAPRKPVVASGDQPIGGSGESKDEAGGKQGA